MIIVYMTLTLLLVFFSWMIYAAIRNSRIIPIIFSPNGILLCKYEGPFNKKPALNDLEEVSNKTYTFKYKEKKAPILFRGSELKNIYAENSISEMTAISPFYESMFYLDVIIFETKNGLFYKSRIPYRGFISKSTFPEIIKKLKETGFLGEPIISIRHSDRK